MKRHKIMIITEQPALDIEHKKPLLEKIKKCKGINRCYGRISGNNNPIAFNTDYYGQDIEKSILPRLKNTIECTKEILDGKITIYWTHYVKCLGKSFKKLIKEKILTEDNVNQCAERWLKNEINKFKPDIVTAIGAYASNYLIYGKGKATYNELNICEYYKSQILLKKIFILPHPSGQNNKIAKDYWNGNVPTQKLKNCLKKMIKNM